MLHICDDSDIASVADLCSSRGFAIEVQAFHDPRCLERTQDGVDRHRNFLASLPNRSLHGAFGDLCPGSADILIRDATRTRIDQSWDMARELEIGRMILHHGYVPGTSRTANYTMRSATFWKNFLMDKPTAFRLHVENVLDRGPEMLRDLVDMMEDARLSTCLDIGHAHCHSNVPIVDWIETLGSRIGYVHLHDNHGTEDEHLGLGSGTAPLPEVFDALAEYAPDAIWALEVNLPEMERSVAWLESHGPLVAKDPAVS